MTDPVLAVVVTAMLDEARPYLRAGGEPLDTPIGRAWRVAIGGHECVLLVSGVGLVNAAAATATLLVHVSPTVLISSGSAGGLAPEVEVGDVVVGSSYAYHDADSTTFGYARGQIPAMPRDYAGDPDLIARALAAEGPAVVRRGPIVSGNSFVYAATVDDVRAAFPTALAADMESAALAQLAYLRSLPYLSVRAISDLCGPHAGHDHETSLDDVSERSAAVVATTIAGLLV